MWARFLHWGVWSTHTPYGHQAKSSQGFPSVCSDTNRGNGLSNPRTDSRTESWRRGKVGVLGQCWDCERATLLV